MTDPHLSSDELAHIALGDTPPDGASEHLAHCGECATNLSLLQSLMAADPSVATHSGDDSHHEQLSPEIVDGDDSLIAPDEHTNSPESPPETDTSRTRQGAGGSHTSPLVVAFVVLVTLVIIGVLAWR